MENPIALLEQASALLARAVATPFAVSDDDTLVAVTRESERVGRHLDGIRALTAAELETRSRRELGDAGLSRRFGYQRGSHLIEAVALVSSAEAVRRIRLGASVAPRASLDGCVLPALFPRVASGMIDGRIGAESAGHIVRALGQAAPNCTVPDLEAAERALAESAEHTAPDLVADQARAWRDHLDTDGALPREERQFLARRFTLGRERDDGMTPFSGLADPVSAGSLRAAVSAFRFTPRFVDDGGADAVMPDGRTAEQRDFDVLLGLVGAGVRADDTFTPGGRASVVATVTLDELSRGVGVGYLDDVRESVPIRTIDHLICDAGVEIAITGSNGALVALTSRNRFFTRRQRRALAARDGGCVWPVCHAPASWADAHHVIERHDGGETAVSNGVLLCPAHHRMLHTSAYRMKMIRGRPHLLAPPSIDPDQTWRAAGRSRLELGIVQLDREHGREELAG